MAAGTPHRSTTSVNGLSLSYVDYGGDGPPCLLLHGATSSAASWGLWVRRTALPLRFVALDQRGHGDSDKPQTGYSAIDLGHDAAVFWDSLGLGPAVVIGASMGGNTALAMAAERPDLVRAVVLSDPAYRIPEPALHAAMEQLSTAPVEFPSWATFLDAMKLRVPGWSVEDIEAYYGVNVYQAPSGGWRWKFDRAALLQVHEHFRDNLRGLAGRVKAPALVVQAGERRVCPDDSARDLLAALPDGRLVTIEGALHSVQIDKQPEFDRAAADFLQEMGIW